MKSIRTLFIVILMLLANTLNKSCKDDTPSIQRIRIVNDSNFIIDKVVIQSDDFYLGFQNISIESSSEYKSVEDISTSLKFYITINSIEIVTDWVLPRELSDYSKGNVLVSGEYAFSISHIEIDETNNDNSVIVILSSSSDHL